MRGRSNNTLEKRRKEMARKEKQQKKGERRVQRELERAQRQKDGDVGEDPDIAGIIPGPQPRDEEL
ncbi:MAG: hypothetical protein ACJ75H_19755 [Thermoanaerobaculia bacterium]